MMTKEYSLYSKSTLFIFRDKLKNRPRAFFWDYMYLHVEMTLLVSPIVSALFVHVRHAQLVRTHLWPGSSC